MSKPGLPSFIGVILLLRITYCFVFIVWSEVNKGTGRNSEKSEEVDLVLYEEKILLCGYRGNHCICRSIYYYYYYISLLCVIKDKHFKQSLPEILNEVNYVFTSFHTSSWQHTTQLCPRRDLNSQSKQARDWRSTQ